MINNVTLVGRLTKDPELKYTPAGVPVANFTLAVNRKYTPEGGEREADFIMCQVWRKPAENVANFLKKGSLAGVEGEIRTRNYEDNQTGKRVYVTEVLANSVQFLEPAGSRDNQQQGGQSAADAANQYQQQRQNNQQQGQQQQNYNNNNQGTYGSNNQQRSQSNNQGNYGNNNQGYNQNNNQQRYNNNNQGNQNRGFTRMDDDPFARNGQIDISDDDLPF